MSVFNKILSLSCREAALLEAKASVDKLTFMEKLKKRLHAKVCPPCDQYGKDNQLLDQAIAKIIDAKAEDSLRLTKAQRSKIKEVLS